MRLATLTWLESLSLALLSQALPSTLENEILNRRQAPSAGAAGVLGSIPGILQQLTAPISRLQPVKYGEVESELRKGAKKVVVSYGPFSIPPSKVSSNRRCKLKVRG
jgi:hypothetical protein